ncbi:hypothetical protein OEV98_05620 [Caldibacillus lycopersici]|uniref:Uncharacterized protein n=1 Tax=Perspicuibacillus lycopersici TaxID=1325689 RepID=A0AAE3IRC7_9BACI|nr:hypothetical protein [Perspicuibacillus lycopersici]MCU9613027.1 hypothetical protein [Perspicuibacillus lycopersici]
MKFSEQSHHEEALKKWNEGITWKENDQERTRNQFVKQLDKESERKSRVTGHRLKTPIIPVFATLVFVGVLAIVLFSGPLNKLFQSTTEINFAGNPESTAELAVITDEMYEKIELGMDYKEVMKMIGGGKERSKNIGNLGTDYEFQGENHAVYLLFDNETNSLTCKGNTITSVCNDYQATSESSEAAETLDVRAVVWNQLPTDFLQYIDGSWQDGKVGKIKLEEGMGDIHDKSYIGKEVYLIEFPRKDKTIEPTHLIVYASIEDYQFLGIGYVE